MSTLRFFELMNTAFRKFGLLFFICLSIGFLQSCKNKDPSVIKVFVRSASNELISGAKVIIIGDVNSNPETLSYVDTVITNGSGFAYFNLEDHFSEGDKDYEVGYFDVIAKQGSKQAEGYVRCRIHTTAVETIYMPV